MKTPQWHMLSPSRLRTERTILRNTPYFRHESDHIDAQGMFIAIGKVWYVGPRSGKQHEFCIRLEYTRGFPTRPPRVYDHDFHFTPEPDGHQFGDGELCLTLPERQEFSLCTEYLTHEVLGATLIWFHKRRLYERIGTWPGPQERHGLYAPIDLLVEQGIVPDSETLITWLIQHTYRTSDDQCEANIYALCPCGSTKSLKFCHHEELRPVLRRLQSAGGRLATALSHKNPLTNTRDDA